MSLVRSYRGFQACKRAIFFYFCFLAGRTGSDADAFSIEGENSNRIHLKCTETKL